MSEITVVDKMKKDMVDAEERQNDAHRKAILKQQLEQQQNIQKDIQGQHLAIIQDQIAEGRMKKQQELIEKQRQAEVNTQRRQQMQAQQNTRREIQMMLRDDANKLLNHQVQTSGFASPPMAGEAPGNHFKLNPTGANR